MSKQAALNVAETVIDATIDVAQEAAEVGETLERIPHLALNGTTRKQQIIILAAVALTSGGVGAAVSHLVTKKVVQAKAEEQIAEQVAAAEKHYTVLTETALPVSDVNPVEAAEVDIRELIAKYNGSELPPKPAAADDYDPEARVNVFTQNTVVGQWDQVQEESKRREDEPYVISAEEYNEGHSDYGQDRLTYFVGDDTLADSDDTPVSSHQVGAMVGESNLLRFGHGSGDENIVYVRNDRLEMDYEIVRAEESYAKAVAGFDPDEEVVPGVRKFRRLDG